MRVRENEITPGRGKCEYEKHHKGEYERRENKRARELKSLERANERKGRVRD